MTRKITKKTVSKPKTPAKKKVVPNFRFLFLRNLQGQPIGCIAMQLRGKSIVYGVSTLNPADQFNRRVARDLALGRLTRRPVKVSSPSEGTMFEKTRCVVESVFQDKTLPGRTQRGAKRWLRNNTITITPEHWNE